MRRKERVDYRSYEPLKEAIESYLINSVKDMARIVTKSKTRDDEQKKKYSEMVSSKYRFEFKKKRRSTSPRAVTRLAVYRPL